MWEFESNRRLGWFGDGKEVHAYHTFLLTKTSEGCHLVTEEVVKGPGAIQFREQQPNVMHEGHHLDAAHRTQVWLAASDQPGSLVTGEYFYHLGKKGTLPAAHDVVRQDRLLAICERLSGIALPE